MTREDILQKHFKLEFGHEGSGQYSKYILDAMQKLQAVYIVAKERKLDE